LFALRLVYKPQIPAGRSPVGTHLNTSSSPSTASSHLQRPAARSAPRSPVRILTGGSDVGRAEGGGRGGATKGEGREDEGGGSGEGGEEEEGGGGEGRAGALVEEDLGMAALKAAISRRQRRRSQVKSRGLLVSDLSLPRRANAGL